MYTIRYDTIWHDRYQYEYDTSMPCLHRSQGIMPGGVSSPVRAFKSVGGNPIVFERVKGAYAWDVDG